MSWLGLVAGLCGTSCGTGIAADVTPPPLGLCLPSQPFGAPARVPGLVDITDTARFSPNELVAYLGQNQSGRSVDVGVSSRAGTSDSFGSPTLLTVLNTEYEDNNPSVTADGLTLYMDSNRSGSYGLFTSTRPFLEAEFAAPATLTSLNVFGEGYPFVTPDGSALYFHSSRLESSDLYRAAKTADGFGPAMRLDVVSTSAIEYAPVVSPDELTIYYYSTAVGSPGGEAIWMATRGSVDESFSSPGPLSGLDGATYTRPEPTWVSPDGCRLYFKGTDHVSGQIAIYVVERTP